MPDLNWNKSVWAGDYDWSAGGEEWSAEWGNSEAQWFGSLYPRIHRFLPCATVLEIAPGYGRWSRFLKNFCNKFILVDLSPQCIDACRKRFAGDIHLEYHVNDGQSLDFIEDGSIDFVFSFDSLVHVENDGLAGYIRQIAAKLTADGVAFLHHSNIYGKKIEGFTHERAASVNAAFVRDVAVDSGLLCRSQEEITWGVSINNEVIDCITTLTPPGSRFADREIHVINSNFMTEARLIKSMSALYD